MSPALESHEPEYIFVEDSSWVYISVSELLLVMAYLLDDPSNEDYILKAFATENGTLNWSHSLTDQVDRSDVVLIRDILYVLQSRYVRTLNSHTGEILWQYDRATHPNANNVDWTDFSIEGQLIGTLDALYLGGDYPVALSPDTGEVLWELDDHLTVHAAVDDELVASRGDTLYVLSESTDDTNVYSGGQPQNTPTWCSSCGGALTDYDDAQFCPHCGAET